MQIVLGITGSIAAYKAAELTRLMVKEGWSVRVVMTEAATRFITPLTMQTLSRNPVGVSMFDTPAEWKPEHIALSEFADTLVIAPASANTIAKLAHGIADNLLTATALACPAPLVIAPAMNDGMYDHPATRDNIQLLKERGAVFVDPDSGDLACGREGRGRMAEPARIFEAIINL